MCKSAMTNTLRAEHHRNAREQATEQGESDSKTRIIRSAEMLIAQYGYHAVNIRQIADHADVPLGMVRYYYGAKDQLFHAIFKRWSHVNQQRVDLLNEVMLDKARPQLLRLIMRAFTSPVLALLKTEEGTNYALLMSRELIHPIKEAELAIGEFFDPMARMFLAAMGHSLPQATKAQLGTGYQFAVSALMSHLHRGRAFRLLGAPLDTRLDTVEFLLDLIVGGLSAAINHGKARSDRSTRARSTPATRSDR
jgi:AcrR family transcriptional regulator